MTDCHPPYAPLTCAQWQHRLAEAEAALHAASIGKQVQSNTYGDTQVTYSKADLSTMQRYVDSTRASMLTACGGGCNRPVRRAIQMIPGG